MFFRQLYLPARFPHQHIKNLELLYFFGIYICSAEQCLWVDAVIFFLLTKVISHFLTNPLHIKQILLQTLTNWILHLNYCECIEALPYQCCVVRILADFSFWRSFSDIVSLRKLSTDKCKNHASLVLHMQNPLLKG